MYRALEAHFTLYLTLYNLYVQTLVDRYPLIEKDLKEGIVNAITNLQECRFATKDQIQRNHEEVLSLITSTDFQNIKKAFDSQLQHQAKFYHNYMTMFESLLLFIRASRQQCWDLHLESLRKLVPYFFAFDMVNYARLSPVYISQMLNLEQEDIATWNILKQGNFSVNKSSVPFTAIGADHGIEQENKSMKILGGIKGITNNQRALDEYFLTAGRMGTIIEEFAELFQIKQNIAHKKNQHYQLTGSKNKRISVNVNKLTEVMSTYGVSFGNSTCLFNIFTKKVMPTDYATRFLKP